MNGGLYTAAATIIAAIIGYFAVQAQRNSKEAIRISKQPTDVSLAQSVLKDTINELRIEINRKDKVIEGLNQSIDRLTKQLGEKDKNIIMLVKERDQMTTERDRLKKKVVELEREKAILKKQQPKTRKGELKI